MNSNRWFEAFVMHNDKVPKNFINIEELRQKISAREQSQERQRLHLGVFRNPAVWGDSLKNVPEKFHKDLMYLAKQHAAISPKVFHWTTIENFKNIIAKNAFFGNAELVENGITFEKNALGDSDVNNGDGSVICCCPGFVDPNALIKKRGEVRKGLIRLTINLHKVAINGTFNQFCKLFDLLAPRFEYKVKITEVFSVFFCKKKRNEPLSCTFFLADKKLKRYINKEDVIFYGNLTEINLFCLTRLFDLIKNFNQDDAENYQTFINYFQSLSADEFIKLAIIFSQSLTVYAEYNFYKKLPITDGLIEEIYVAENNKTIFLKDFSSAEKNKIFSEIGYGNAWLEALQSEQKPLVEIIDGQRLLQYGIPIDYMTQFMLMEADLSLLDPKQVNDKKYFETRPGLNNDLISQLDFDVTNSLIYEDIQETLTFNKLEIKVKIEDLLKKISKKYKKYDFGFDRGFSCLFAYINRIYAPIFEDFVKIVIKSGMDVNYRNKCGITLLHQAAFFGNVTVAKILLEHGANYLLTTKHPLLTIGGFEKEFGRENLTAANIVQLKYAVAGHYQNFCKILSNPQKTSEKLWNLALQEQQMFLETFKEDEKSNLVNCSV